MEAATAPPVIDLPADAATEQPQDPEAPPVPEGAVSTSVEGTPQEQNGITIVVEYDENGGLRTGIVPLGDVRLTEVPTILRVATKNFDREQGLS